MSYDTKCHDLAEAFIEDCPQPIANVDALIAELAQRIQDEIEDFLTEKGIA